MGRGFEEPGNLDRLSVEGNHRAEGAQARAGSATRVGLWAHPSRLSSSFGYPTRSLCTGVLFLDRLYVLLKLLRRPQFDLGDVRLGQDPLVSEVGHKRLDQSVRTDSLAQ